MTLEEAQDEVMRLQDWVDDLQSGMWVNCVYCGHNYGPAKCSKCKGKGIIGDWRDADEMECSQCNGTGEDTPVAMADVLKEHIAVCPLHPMSKMRAALEAIRELLAQAPDNTYAYTCTKISQQVDAVLK